MLKFKLRNIIFCLFFIFGSIVYSDGTQTYDDSYSYENEIYQDKLTSDSFQGNPTLDILSTHYNETTAISIIGNSGFSGYPGSGTVNDPYRIEGLNITATNENLIYLDGTTAYFTISNNWLNGLSSSTFGIYLENVTNGIISNNTITNNFATGIFMGNSNEILIQNNIINDNLYAGIDFYRSNFNTVVNNLVSGNLGWAGISYVESSDNEILDNIVKDNLGNGIIMDYSKNSLIQNNVINDNSYAGIRIVRSSSNIDLITNQIFHNFEWGINVHDSQSIDIQGNIAENNLLVGILVDVSQNIFIEGNSVKENSAQGIWVGGSSFVYLINNMLSSNVQNSEITLYKTMDSQILDNYVSDAPDIGIVLESSIRNVIKNNTITNSPTSGITLFSSDNNDLSNNVIYSNLGSGMKLQDSSSNIVNRNIIYDNQDSGIRIKGDDNTVTENDLKNNKVPPHLLQISQIYDQGQNNHVSENYYDDWLGPEPYRVDGGANQDVMPSSYPLHMSQLQLDLEGDISDSMTVSWNKVNDSYNHDITYFVWYSLDAGISWIELVSNLGSDSYTYDTSGFDNVAEIQFKVQAIDEIGYVSEATVLVVNEINNSIDKTSNEQSITSSSTENSRIAGIGYPHVYVFLLSLSVISVIIRKQKRSI